MCKLIEKFKAIRMFLQRFIPLKKELGYCGKNSIIEYPVWFESKKTVFIQDNVKVRALSHFINSPSENIIIKKYTVLATNCTIITNNHRSTVGIPQFLLGVSHINDKSVDVVVEEDVWVGANVTILAGANLGRGCIIGAGAIVSKPVPPYAVVSGIPAKIVAVKFSIEQILEHEKKLYSEKERFSRDYLENLFAKYYLSTKVFGISSVLNDDEINRLNVLKKKRNFVEPY